MTGYNRVVLVGHLTRDPEVRQTPGGTSVADLGLATNERYKNRDGEMVETTCFVDIVAWARQAEVCGQFLSKGSPVLVEGRLQFDRWETDDGHARSKLRVRADRVRFMGSKRGGDQTQATAAGHGSPDAEDALPF